MMEDMTMRKFAQATHHDYLHKDSRAPSWRTWLIFVASPRGLPPSALAAAQLLPDSKNLFRRRNDGAKSPIELIGRWRTRPFG
jgi:hypothetical protein